MGTIKEILDSFNEAMDEIIGNFISEPKVEMSQLLEEVEQKNLDDFIKRYKGDSDRLDDILELLIDRGYFVCPAAASHHGNHIGGLYEHSKQVALELHKMTVRLGLEWKEKDSPLIVGLLHDLCKLDQYTFKETEDGYEVEYNKEQLFCGHGEKSLIIALDYIDYLTEEEQACIRYHMGAFTDEKEWKYYTRAIKKYPNVLFTHTADMVASQIMNI